MDTVDSKIIEKITALADELPQSKRRELLNLISTWQTNTRYASREPYSESLTFTSIRGRHIGIAKDVSSTGLFIQTDEYFDIGEKIELSLTFISAPNPLHLKGKIVRKTKDGIGIRFDERSRSDVMEMESVITKMGIIFRGK